MESHRILACGWAFLIWGTYMYLWSFFVYAWQVVMVLFSPTGCRRSPAPAMADQALGGYDPYSGLVAHTMPDGRN